MKNPAFQAKSTIQRTARLIAPNSFLAITIITAIFAELVFVGFCDENIYTSPRTTLLGISFVTFFWVTVGWSLYFLGCFYKRITEGVSRFHRLTFCLVVTTLLCFAVLLYSLSWFLFFQSGRFANFETWRFITFNFHHLWTYVVAAEPIHLFTASILLLLAFTAIPFVLVRSTSKTWPDSNRLVGRQFIAWMVLWLTLSWSWINLSHEDSVHRRVHDTRAVKHRLHPTMTLYTSHLESRNGQVITDSLANNSLVRLPRQTVSTKRVPIKSSLPKPNAPSVIFVAIESLRHDTIHQWHQGQEVLPNINKLAKNGIEFSRAYSQSTHSDYADVCLVSSLYPLRTQGHYYYGPHDPYPRTLIYDILAPTGYATAIISSQNEAWGGMDHFLEKPSLHTFYHPETSRAETTFSELDTGFAHEVRTGGLVAGKLTDEHTTSKAIEWIEAQVQANRPFFLSMNFQSSHFPYLISEDCARPFQPASLAPSVSFVEYPKEQTENVRNAYFNSIHECDRQIGHLAAALKRLGRLDNTILVITGENGESFHECGTVTHAREPVEPAIHIACIMHAPNFLKPTIEDYPFEHVDLVPSVLGLMGRPSHPNFQGINVFSTDRPLPDHRLTFCHVNSCFARADTILLGGRWKLTDDQSTQATTLHDVIDDPLQSENLIDQYPELADQLKQLLEEYRLDQLAYYHFPNYHLTYYPPQPPTWPSTSPIPVNSPSAPCQPTADSPLSASPLR